MGNFDFSKCYECKYCYEAIEEKSHELIKKEETDYNANTAIQSLGEKPEPESLPIESTAEKKKCNAINPNASLPQENKNINNKNNNNIKISDGDFVEDSSFINDENSKKNSNDINNDNIDEKEEKKRSENIEELKRNENGEEREDRKRDNQIQDGENQNASNKREN